MEYAITTRDVPDQLVVFVRGRTTREELPAFLGASFDRIVGELTHHGSAPNGETLVIYHEVGPDGIDCEVCVPVAPDAVVSGDLWRRIVPAATVAETLHIGSYDGLARAYDAVAIWIRDHGLTGAGPARERYLEGPGEEVPEADYRTRIEFPVERALVAAG